MNSNLKISKEVQCILDKIDDFRIINSVPKDPKIKPLSEFELSILPELPERWSWVISNDISAFITNGVHSPTTPTDEIGINKKMLRITDLNDNEEPNFNDLPYCKRFIEGDYEKTIKKNDIYISFTGNKLGKRYIAKKNIDEVVFAHYFVRWRPIIVNPKYVYYVLLSHHFDRFMYEHTLGSTQPNLKVTDLKRVPIPIAPLDEQEQIAKIFSSIDEKIQTNSVITKKLEKMAQAIFKQWFVNFEPFKDEAFIETSCGSIPKSWSISELDKCCILITKGITPKYVDESEQRVINQKCIRNNKINLNLARFHEPKKINEKWLEYGDILINSTGEGTLGRVAQVLEEPINLTVDSHITIVRPVKKQLINYLGCLLLMKQSVFERMASGSTGQTDLPRDLVKSMEVILPCEQVLEHFSELVNPLRQQMILLQNENIQLEILRESLLPKLMSGEIRVPLNN